MSCADPNKSTFVLDWNDAYVVLKYFFVLWYVQMYKSDSSDWLCRFRMTQYHWGYCKLEYNGGYCEGMLQLLHTRYSCHSSCSIPSMVLPLRFSGTASYDYVASHEDYGCVNVGSCNFLIILSIDLLFIVHYLVCITDLFKFASIKVTYDSIFRSISEWC